MLYTFQLELIRLFHQIRYPILDEFFKFLNFFDTPEFYFLLIPIVWLGYHWKSGVKLFYIILLSTYVNFILKMLFHQPRPFFLDPVLAVIKVKGYGFPSGAAQSAVILSCILITAWKQKKIAWIVGINFFFWLSLSRVYLGVHFISDILGGWIIGGGIFAIYYYLFPKIEKFLKKISNFDIFKLNIILVLIILMPFVKFEMPTLAINLFAISVGIYFSMRHHIFLDKSKNILQFFVRAVLAILTFLIISWITTYLIDLNSYKGFKIISVTLQNIIFGLWLSLGFSYFYKLSLKGARK